MADYVLHPILGVHPQEITGRACKHCGSLKFDITIGKGPHCAGLYCHDCHEFHGWLPKAWYEAMLSVHGSRDNG